MRARMLKPSFFKSEQLASCTPHARLLFAGLWCLSDREGRLEDRPLRIKAELFPYDSVEINELLEELVRARLITRYSADRAYICIDTFTRHQNPHRNENESVIPPPNEQKTQKRQTAKKKRDTEQQNSASARDQVRSTRDQVRSTRVKDESAPACYLNTSNLKLEPSNLNTSNLKLDSSESEPNVMGNVALSPSQKTSEVDRALISIESASDQKKKSKADSANDVFTYWRAAAHKNGHVVLSAKRFKAITARLTEGYTVAELKLAIDGNLSDEWYQGENDRHAVFNDIELICRSASHVDRFIQTALNPQSLKQSILDTHDKFLMRHGIDPVTEKPIDTKGQNE